MEKSVGPETRFCVSLICSIILALAVATVAFSAYFRASSKFLASVYISLSLGILNVIDHLDKIVGSDEGVQYLRAKFQNPCGEV